MNDWYFPRPQLAEHYVQTLELGISNNLAIIAPRRKGKTFFILQEVSPLAQKRNFYPVYASLWQNTNSPHEGIILALEEALDALSKKSPVKRILDTKIKKTRLSNELIGKLELEFAETPSQATSRELLVIDKLLTQLQQKIGKKKVLLLIDEVQHLATNKAFDPLAHALRTIIDKRQGQIKTLFTGSSRHYMQLLFNNSESPFYHFVETVPFPDFGHDFTLFIQERLKVQHDILVSEKELYNAFLDLDKSPFWMMRIIGNLLTYGQTLRESQSYVLQLLEASEGFENIAKHMKPIDKIVFTALSENKNPYSKELLDEIDRSAGVKGIAPNVQRSLKRMMSQYLITQIGKGEYYIEKPGLKRYLKDA